MKDLETLPIADDIQRLKAEMLKLEQADLPTEHHWHGGIYMRVLPRPAGCTIVGKVHRKPHFYLVVKGKVTVVGNGERNTITAPAWLKCEPGTQRAVYAHEDSICLTVHRTDKETLEETEAELVEPDSESPYLPGNTLNHKKLMEDL